MLEERKERKVCVRKDPTTSRNKERIPIICNLIVKLWMEYRQVDEEVGFYYIIKELERIEDSFYWEEDRWYDELQNMIKEKKKEKTNYEITITDKGRMIRTVGYFEHYWSIYTDLRLAQIIKMVDDTFQNCISKYDFLDSAFWQKFFVPMQIQVLQSSLKALEFSRDYTLSKDNEELTDSNKIESLRKLTEAIKVTQAKIDQLKGEYSE